MTSVDTATGHHAACPRSPKWSAAVTFPLVAAAIRAQFLPRASPPETIRLITACATPERFANSTCVSPVRWRYSFNVMGA